MLDNCYRLRLDVNERWKGYRKGETLLPFLSFSAADLFKTCPKAWEYRYVTKPAVERDDDSMLRFGSSIHHALEHIYKNYLNTGEFPAPVEVTHYVRAGLDEFGPWGPAEYVKLRTEGFKLVNSYLASGGRLIRPVITEAEFLLEGPNNLLIYGALDLTTMDGVVDYKVTWHPRALENGESTVQLDVYAAVYYLITGHWPKELVIGNMIRSVGKAVFLYAEMPSPEKVMRTLNWLSETWQATRTGPYPATPSAQACKWCQYKKVCEDRWRGEKVA